MRARLGSATLKNSWVLLLTVHLGDESVRQSCGAGNPNFVRTTPSQHPAREKSAENHFERIALGVRRCPCFHARPLCQVPKGFCRAEFRGYAVTLRLRVRRDASRICLCSQHSKSRTHCREIPICTLRRLPLPTCRKGSLTSCKSTGNSVFRFGVTDVAPFTWMISARMLTAISSGEAARMSSPAGPRTWLSLAAGTLCRAGIRAPYLPSFCWRQRHVSGAGV
jgi:hypothetical protein